MFFEQSGTFKNEFKILGIEAEDYDILNDFGETDNVVDLRKEIAYAYYLNEKTVFDYIHAGEIYAHKSGKHEHIKSLDL